MMCAPPLWFGSVRRRHLPRRTTIVIRRNSHQQPGVRFLAAFKANGYLVVPYLNVTWEHQFGDSTQSLSAALLQPGAVPISLSYPVFDARDFGKLEGGVTVELGLSTILMLGGASTFASDGHDFRVSAGLSFRF
jgi:hypothetical protein